MAWDEVARLIDAAEVGGSTVGLTLTTAIGDRFAHHGDRRFRAASTVKIPVMVELYRQIERGERSLTERFVLRDEDRAPGSGVLLHLHAGLELTLDDLIYLMIAISDNTATNMLIELAGMAQVNLTMRELGMRDSTLGRLMKGLPAQGAEQENWATPDDYAMLIAALLNWEAAAPASCEAMIATLEKQQCTNRISRYLPEGVRWGSKTGQITSVSNDVGFVIAPHGTLIISAFCEAFPDEHIAEQFIGDVTRAALLATDLGARREGPPA